LAHLWDAAIIRWRARVVGVGICGRYWREDPKETYEHQRTEESVAHVEIPLSFAVQATIAADAVTTLTPPPASGFPSHARPRGWRRVVASQRTVGSTAETRRVDVQRDW
jgi:hypothetical protein